MVVKKSKKPLEFFTWLRSGLRSMSRRYPAIYEALARAKRPYKGLNKHQRYEYECAACGGYFSGKQVAVDHRIDCGALKSWDDVLGFMQRLFCATDVLDVLCHPCHDLKTYSTKHGVSIKEAMICKAAIAFVKANTPEQVVAYLLKMGYTKEKTSNANKRKLALEEIFRRES